MYIQAGWLKGKKILGQKSGLRPTTSLVKGALLNIIKPKLLHKSFVDCFAGTGSIGFEALSIGASHVGFVELNKKAIEYLNKNTEHLAVKESVSIKHMDVFSFLQSSREKWDILFFSPPYDTIHWYHLLRAIESSPIIEDDTLVIVQHPKQIILEPKILKKNDEREYGFNHISFFNK